MIEIRVSGKDMADIKSQLNEFLLAEESDPIKSPACEAEEYACPKSPDEVDPVNEAPKAEKEALYSLEEIRALLRTARERVGGEAVKALLKKYGAETVPALAADHYDAVVAEATDLITKEAG